MESKTPFHAYKETKLDLDPATTASIVSIRLPSPNVSSQLSRTAQRRSHITEIPVAEDEIAFRQRHLASAASIYHRVGHKLPRSFLWRILEDGKVLSIQAVDASRPKNAADANLTLRLSFPTSVLPGCVALSGSNDHDILSVFACTDSKHLYTLSLRPEYFRKSTSTEDNSLDWCKIYTSPGLSVTHPHRLVALNSNELLVSLGNGDILKLSRDSASDGHAWKETHYNEGASWNIRSFNPFQGSNTVRYGDLNLAPSVATSIASPEITLGGMSYAFIVSLDHRLRIWNLSAKQLVYNSDLLAQEVDQNERKVIDPSQSQLVKVYPVGDGSLLCVTYSPFNIGEFKFWNVSDAGDDGKLHVTDLFPQTALHPQRPSWEEWTLADFSVVLNVSEPNMFVLWVLWKNNVTYRLRRLDFQSGTGNPTSLDGEWMAMATETLRSTLPPPVFPGDPSGGTDKWLKFILTPSRFSIPTLEAGLAIYGHGQSAPKGLGKSGTLAERMCATIASTASLTRKSDGNMDFDQFRAATDTQWRRFYRLLLELDKQRGEAMALVIDPQGKMPWVVLADGLTAVRTCSELEKIWHNTGMTTLGTDYVARPMFAASAFRESFSEQLLHDCQTMVLEEIFQEPSFTDLARMRVFYEKCDFSNQIGDDDFAQLVSSLGQGFKDVTLEVYKSMLELMITTEKRSTQKLPLTELGNKLVVKGVQETVELHRNVCLDQLVLLVLIENEINHTEEGIQFETDLVFNHTVDILKRLELINWLASTQITLPLEIIGRRNSITDQTLTAAKKIAPRTETITVLELVLRHLFSLDLEEKGTMAALVTEVVRRICSPGTPDYQTTPAAIQAFLLKNGRPDLATEFSRFADRDAFSIYIQGRAYLAANDPLTAAILFKKAAFGMSSSNSAKREDGGLLEQTELNLLNSGLPKYYSHIVALFDKEKVYSFVIDFARLSLQFIRSGPSDTQTRLLRSEMHSRLFNAAIQTARYELAYSILVLFTDSALQQSSIRTLVTKMCESSHASELIELPFIGLQDSIDEILAQKCQSIVDVNVGVPYHKILYAWRIKRNDFRGAAAISLDRLQKLEQSGDGDKMIGDDGLETPVTRQYITLINALSCVDPEQAWILSEELPRRSNGAGISKNVPQPKRKVVTLDDVRRSYQEELDRIAAIQNNQFAFAGGDEMEMDVL